MKHIQSDLLFEFTIQNQSNKIFVKKEFNAKLPLLWDAYTKSDMLDHWWAPVPYKNETLSMDFREGGKWHYCMISPEGERHYCLLNYLKINPLKNFEAKDSFCDQAGNPTDEFPSMNWNTVFSHEGEKTKIEISISFDSEKDLQTIITLGFKEGFTAGLNQLEALLEQKTR